MISPDINVSIDLTDTVLLFSPSEITVYFRVVIS